MEDFHITNLDFLLNKLIEYNDLITSDCLWNRGEYKSRDDAQSDFAYYQSVFNKLDIAEVRMEQDNNWIRPNINTQNFYRNGGFTAWDNRIKDSDRQKLNEKKAVELKNHLEIENLKLQNEAMNYEAQLRSAKEELRKLSLLNSRLQKRAFKRLIPYSVISFLLGAIVTNLPYLIDLIYGS